MVLTHQPQMRAAVCSAYAIEELPIKVFAQWFKKLNLRFGTRTVPKSNIDALLNIEPISALD